MKSKEYWEKRSGEQLLDLLQNSDQVLKTYYNDYELAKENINAAIEKLYGKFAEENKVPIEKAREIIKGKEYRKWRMSMDKYLKLIGQGEEVLQLELNVLCMRPRIDRLTAIEAEIVANMTLLAKAQENATEKHLIKSFEDTYYKNMYEAYKDENPKIIELMHKHHVALDKTTIKTVLSTPWSGANYSKNIWKREYDVASKVRRLVTRNILEGRSINELARVIEGELGKDYRHAAKRLIHTETAYIKGQADIQTYKDLDVEDYEFRATLDMKTSSVCRSLDKKHFKLSNAKVGVNYPPMHPECRSITIRFKEDRKDDTRAARGIDGKAYKVPANMSYDDWYKKYILKTRDKGYNNKQELIKKVKDFDLGKANVKDIVDLGKMVNKEYEISDIIGNKEELKKVFSNFRDIGGAIDKKSWGKGSSKIVKDQLNEAFSNYPKDWSEIPKKSDRKLIARKTKRGFFAPAAITGSGYFDLKLENYEDGYFTIASNGTRKTTPFHEIGHMVEYSNPDILRINKEFIAKRTKGEKPTKLSSIFPGWGYSSSEVTKKDDFVSPYIGKEYDDATEVLSMGLQGIYEPDELYMKSFNEETEEIEKMKITDDEEFLNLTIGILLKG